MAGAQDTTWDTECEVCGVTETPHAEGVGKEAKLLTAEEIEYTRWLMVADLRQEYHWRANAMCDAALRAIAAEARLNELRGSAKVERLRHRGQDSSYSVPQMQAEFSFAAIQRMYWACED